MTELIPLEFPLHGTRLIEASAGTGKTYNIGNLYLRLVLGMGVDDEFEPVPVEKILVVTFTRAAAAELRGRIRDLLELAYQVFRNERATKHELINSLANLSGKQNSKEEKIRLLNLALMSMDDASISTIHSFAVKAAKTFVFETGALADVEIAQDSRAKKQQVLNDVFRELLFKQDSYLATCLAAMGLSKREEFLKYFGSTGKHHRIVPDFQQEYGGRKRCGFRPCVERTQAQTS